VDEKLLVFRLLCRVARTHLCVVRVRRRQILHFQIGVGGERGYVQEKIEKFVPALKEKNFFICGLNNMITAVNDRLLALGVPKEQIHFERYD
jgi:ferredoxin-NADP reductase